MTHLNGDIYLMTKRVNELTRKRENLARVMVPICDEIKSYLSNFLHQVEESAKVSENGDLVFFKAFDRKFEVRLDSRWSEEEVTGLISIYINTSRGMYRFDEAEFNTKGEVHGVTIGDEEEPDPLPIEHCAGVLVANWLLGADVAFEQVTSPPRI